MALAVIVFITLWNIRLHGPRDWQWVYPQKARPVTLAVGLHQFWNLFAPYPSREDGWFVIPAKLADGTEVDLFRDAAPVSWDPPEDRRGEFSSVRHFQHMINLWKRRYKQYREPWARYMCRTWKQRLGPERQPERIDLVYMLEKTPEPGKEGKVAKRRIWRQNCIAKKKKKKKDAG